MAVFEENLPLLETAINANIRLLSPDFEYVFFDNTQVETFIDSEFPQYRPVFGAFPIPIQRYDFSASRSIDKF